MNNSESFDINLVGGGEPELKKQILLMDYSNLLRVKEIIKKDMWQFNYKFRINENIFVQRLINNLAIYIKNLKIKLFKYKEFINDTIIVKRKEIFLKKLKEKIIKLANSSQQKNIKNIDDPNRNSYIKDIKELLNLI